MSVVALVTGPDPGHALPVLGVARALRARGHTTIVATGTQHEPLVVAEGHRFLALPLLDPQPADVDFGHVLWRRAGQMAPPLRTLLAPLGPDLVVTDTLTTAGTFVADLLGVPWVEVSPHHLVDPAPDVPPIGMGLPPATTARRRRADDRIRAAQARSIGEGEALRDEVRASIGLGPPTAPRARLLQTLPALEPPRAAWPQDAHVVGQLAIDPPLPPLAPPPGDAPLVVVTDTTATALPTPLGRSVVEACRGLDVRLVVTGGAADLTADAGPDVVVGRGPHEPLLDAAAAAVCPGGGGFVAKALSRGVPLVVAPIAGDQRETAGRVDHVGAGVWLHDLGDPTLLRDAVARVVTDARYRAAAARVADGARGLGAERAADLVEAALTDAVPVAPGP